MPAPVEVQGPPTVAMEPVTTGVDPQVRNEIASFFFRNRTFVVFVAKIILQFNACPLKGEI
jgi:hypothetical protein